MFLINVKVKWGWIISKLRSVLYLKTFPGNENVLHIYNFYLKYFWYNSEILFTEIITENQ